jgi:ABC-type branched-subunit amino acid transport system substrate-binding protein
VKVRGLRIGAFAPLTSPGLVPAGRHLKAGLELGLEDLNDTGGVEGRTVEMLLRDTAGTPERAGLALGELDADGVVAVVGEFHSAVARPLAELASARGLPFVCSSATLDNLTSRPVHSVARVAPPQSHGWRVYADYLSAAGHQHVALAIYPDEYWSSGAAVLEARLREHGAQSTRIDVRDLSGSEISDRVANIDPVGALLLLAGYPEPSADIVRALRPDRRHDHLLIGDPAGRAEFPEWLDLLGGDGLGIPYLRYVASELSEIGASVTARLAVRLGEPPSFVALEGYDTIQVLAGGLRVAGDDRQRLGRALAHISVAGTRGPLRFSRAPGIGVLQWVWPPVQVVAHTDAGRWDRVTLLREEAPEGSIRRREGG